MVTLLKPNNAFKNLQNQVSDFLNIPGKLIPNFSRCHGITSTNAPPLIKGFARSGGRGPRVSTLIKGVTPDRIYRYAYDSMAMRAILKDYIGKLHSNIAE